MTTVAILEIIRLLLELAVLAVKDMPPESRAAFWERHEARMAFWDGLAKKLIPEAPEG
jgi:hypothetical protein